MTSAAPITAILVAYNSSGVIAQALESLVGKPEIAQVIVVDNCSHDDTCELISRRFPEVSIIENPKNLGFGCGNNVALKKVKTPYALLVNPDAVLHEGALGELLAAAQRNPDAAILAPLLYDSKGRLHESYKRSVFAREKGRDHFLPPEGDLCADFLSGAVWLVNMKHMQKTGFFDPDIFLYYEDDDLCLRARAAGLSLVLVHGAKAVHLMGASCGVEKPESIFFKQRHMTWSRLHVEQKHKGREAAARLAAKLRLSYSLRAAWHMLSMNAAKTQRYRGRIRGVFEFESGKRS